MCTNKTLETKIKRFQDLNATIKAAEEEKRQLQDWIINEYSARQITEYAPKSGAYNAKLISQKRETLSKKALAEVLPDTWQAIWSAGAKTTISEYIRIY